MRKITESSLNAFVANRPFSKSNMIVEIDGNKTKLRLHGNLIATKEGNELIVCDCGWQSNTTKERLNAIFQYYQLGYIFQKNFIWYFQGKENECKVWEDIKKTFNI